MRKGIFEAITWLITLSCTSFNVHWCFLPELLNAMMVVTWWFSNSVILSVFISLHPTVMKNFLFSPFIYLYQDGWILTLFTELWSVTVFIILILKLSRFGQKELFWIGFCVLLMFSLYSLSKHFLLFWHKEVLQPHFVLSLP